MALVVAEGAEEAFVGTRSLIPIANAARALARTVVRNPAVASTTAVAAVGSVLEGLGHALVDRFHQGDSLLRSYGENFGTIRNPPPAHRNTVAHSAPRSPAVKMSSSRSKNAAHRPKKTAAKNRNVIVAKSIPRSVSVPVSTGMIGVVGDGFALSGGNFDGRPGATLRASGTICEVMPSNSQTSAGVYYQGVFPARLVPAGTDVVTPGGFPTYAFPFPTDNLGGLDLAGVRAGAAAICIAHPALMTARIARVASLFCQYRIRRLNLRYSAFANTGVSGQLAFAIMEARQPSEIREHATNASVASLKQLSSGTECGVVPVWATGPVARFTSRAKDWYSCLLYNAEAASNGFESTAPYWGPDPSLASGSGFPPGNNAATQLLVLGASAGVSLLSPAVGASVFARTGYLDFDVEIDFKDLCMVDSGMVPPNPA